MKQALAITILVDNAQAWIVPYAEELQQHLSHNHQAQLVFDAGDVPPGDMLFLLGCTKLISEEILSRNRNNFVVHESDLPQGRGWSPLSWQVLEGKDRIPITLFEAVPEMDAGPVYLQDVIELDGTELLPELKEKQGAKTIELCLRLVDQYPDLEGKGQQGEASYYRKRTTEDDEIDPNRSLAEQFDHLRIVDNERFPAWFMFRGQKYIVKIYKEKSNKQG